MYLNELINRSRLALDHLSSFLKRFVLSIRASFDFFKKVSQMTIKFIVWILIYLFSPRCTFFTTPNNCRCFYLNRYFNLCPDISHRSPRLTRARGCVRVLYCSGTSFSQKTLLATYNEHFTLSKYLTCL